MKKISIAIIGGGASGIVSAISAKQSCHDVEITIFEKQDKLAKKILATGNGRCNLSNQLATNNYQEFLSQYNDEKFVDNVFRQIPPLEVYNFFEKLGLATVVDKKTNGIYPRTFEAVSVWNVLINAVKSYGIKYKLESNVVEIVERDGKFNIVLQDRSVYSFDKVIFAVGSSAGQRDKLATVEQQSKTQQNFLKKIVSQFGHSVTALYPCLVPIKTDIEFIKGLSGVRQNVKLVLKQKGKQIYSEFGEVLFRDYGISGIVTFNISMEILKRVLCEQQLKLSDFSVEIDLFCDFDVTGFITEQLNICKNSHMEAINLFSGCVNANVAKMLFKKAKIQLSKPIKDVTKSDVVALCKEGKHFNLQVIDFLSYENAQVVAGGIENNEVDCKTMQSKKQEGFFVTGEALNIYAKCGGFNLHFAFASGILAGKNAVKNECKQA